METELIKTTFFEDFAIANLYGEKAIKDTYRRSFKEFKDDYRYLTALVIALNQHCWEEYDKQDYEKSKLYSDLFYEARDYALDTLKDEEFKYFYELTD